MKKPPLKTNHPGLRVAIISTKKPTKVVRVEIIHVDETHEVSKKNDEAPFRDAFLKPQFTFRTRKLEVFLDPPPIDKRVRAKMLPWQVKRIEDLLGGPIWAPSVSHALGTPPRASAGK